MAPQDRHASAALTQLAELAAAPWRFDFHRALRLLECAHPELPRLGHSRQPAEDPWRLGQQPTMRFAPGPLAAVEPATAARPERLLVYLFGLLGPNGPMPLHLTEYVIDRLRGNYGPGKNQPDSTVARFLDVFHHRLLSLFWRAHADAEPAIEADRPQQDRFARRLLALAGFLNDGPADNAPTVRRARRYWVGHLARPARNAEGLTAMLTDFFEFGVRVEQFVGRWLPMPGTERCRLGGGLSALGQTAFLGDEVWDCAQTIRIVCGPLGLSRYESLLPGGHSWQRLRQLVRDYLGDEIGWEAALVLQQVEVPATRLGNQLRLGWTAWLGDTPAAGDRADLVLQSESVYRHKRHEPDPDHE
jgi:type VI secretion system protein ImpH